MKKSNKTKKAQIDLLQALKNWEDIVDKHEKEFLNRFCHKAWMLVKVSWSSETMEIVYVLAEGQHICDQAPISKWLEFVKKFDIITNRKGK